MRSWAIVVVAIGSVTSASQATVHQFATRGDFNTMFPGATFEDFEEARVAFGTAAVMENILDSATNNSIFHTGEIVDGLRISVNDSPSFPENLLVSGEGFANYVSHAISFDGPDTATPQITINLTHGNAQGVAFDVTSNPNGNTVGIELFSGTTSLGTFAVVGSGAGTFFGAWSDSDAITAIRLTDGNYFGIDNVAFAAIPEPGALALLGMSAVALVRRRR